MRRGRRLCYTAAVRKRERIIGIWLNLWVGIAFVIGLSAADAADFAPPEILPLDQLSAGLTGVGKTVFRGTEIETFEFEIVDVLETEGYATNLILIRVGGAKIDELGGIAAGMSGSPLYINGKLIGAVAFTTPFADTHYGYATPIGDMLKVFDQGPDLPPDEARPLDRLPASAPLMVAGLRGRALQVLSRVFGRQGRRVQDEPPGPDVPIAPVDPELAPSEAQLQPGAAIAASLSTGDVVLTALGTLTYRDGNRLLAFGHPFLQRGATSLFLHPAYIYGVVPSVELPFKVGAPAGPPLGAFVQDRAAGLAGLVGRAAEQVELTVTARDAELGRSRTLNVQLVRDEELLPTLAAVCLMQAMSEVMDRAGGGTAEMSWTVAAEGLDQPLARRDLVYSSTDIIGEALAGPMFTIDALLRNDFASVRAQALTIRCDVTQTRRTVRLIGLNCRPKQVKPGETLAIDLRLQPYRGAPFERSVQLTVPPETTPQKLVIEAHGRAEALAGPMSQASLLARGIRTPQSLPELVAALASVQRGNVLAAELLTPEAATAREQSMERLKSLPELDLFSDEVASLPTLGNGHGEAAVEPLAREELAFEQVVQGRLRDTVQVIAP